VLSKKHEAGFDPAPYLDADKEAREAGRGMWVQGNIYVNPREWRRINQQ
jgi:endonuclease YncB( thermonuclease family)